MEKLVSVIVPVYNVEKYLCRCLDSIISQSYKKIEIILVDDGSKDRSADICDEYQRNNNRIQVIHKANGGLSDARNVGIKKSSGDYLLLVDADDYVHPHMIHDLLELACTYHADIVECGVHKVKENEEVNWKVYKDLKENVYKHDQAIKLFLDYNGCSIVAWNKLYRKKLFDSIKFPKGKIHEDEFTVPYLVDYADRYVLTPNCYYAYVQRSNSIMSSKFSQKRLDILEAHRKRYRFFNHKYDGRFDKIILYHMFLAYASILCEIDKSSDAIELGNIDDIYLQYHKIYKKILHYTDISLYKKIKLYMYRYFPQTIFKLKTIRNTL